MNSPPMIVPASAIRHPACPVCLVSRIAITPRTTPTMANGAQHTQPVMDVTRDAIALPFVPGGLTAR